MALLHPPPQPVLQQAQAPLLVLQFLLLERKSPLLSLLAVPPLPLCLPCQPQVALLQRTASLAWQGLPSLPLLEGVQELLLQERRNPHLPLLEGQHPLLLEETRSHRQGLLGHLWSQLWV